MKMKGVKQIEMDKNAAKAAWHEYCAALKGKKGGFLKDYYALKSAYFILKDGRKIVDVFEAMKRAGLTVQGYPRLVIAPLKFRRVLFKAQDLSWGGQNGGGTFSEDKWNAPIKFNSAVVLPRKTWDFARSKENPKQQLQVEAGVSAQVPMVPAKYLPPNSDGYFVLWEVDKWSKWEDKPKDPFLLKRISENLFAVMAYWDLTPLERAIFRR